MTDRAEQMREAARKHILSQVDAFAPEFRADDPGLDFLRVLAAEVGALPLPPAPTLADDVAGVVSEHTALLRSIQVTGVRANRDMLGTTPVQEANRVIKSSADLIERLAARAEKAEAEVARLREVIFGAMSLAESIYDDGMATLTPKGADHEL